MPVIPISTRLTHREQCLDTDYITVYCLVQVAWECSGRNEISNKIRTVMNSWSNDFKKAKADRALATRRLNESRMTKDELEIKKKQRSNIHK